ncbi:hypothetical protein Ari01nite_17080 [Paractinoplanes rishiriensis]|uniref:Diguanylate cyclase n=2 Tax=Paractinoplanes rishiriensis TaxID=1050105 RepID=A0A919JT11_9ACTN|nr:hypothetical protein Ari01nite_17080 [Actinoplanes rishiriensis]
MRPRWVRTPADPVLLVLGLAGLLMAPWFLLAPAGAGPASGWLLQSAIDATTVVIAVRLYRLPGTTRHARRFWLATAVSMSLSGIGDVYQSTLVLTGLDHGVISPVQTAFVVTGMVTVVITMLCHPLGGAGRQRLRLWLDASTVLTAVAAFLWYFLLAGELSGGKAADRLAATATAISMMLVTFGLVKLIFSPTAPFTRLAGMIGALGVAGTAIGAPVMTALTARPDPGILQIAQLLPCLLIPMSLRIQEVQIRRLGGRRETAERRGFSKLPYVAVAATQMLLVVALIGGNLGLSIWGVTAGVVLSTALVLVRQMVAFHDNERLVVQLSDQKEWFSALVQHAWDLTVVTRDDGTVGYASPAASRVLGADLAGVPIGEWAHPADMPVILDLLARLAAAPGTHADAEVRLRHTDGSYRWLHVVGTDLRGNSSIAGIVWNGRDITESRRLQDELRHQATHDALTGLANRALLQQRVREAVPHTRLGVLLVDLDGFKQVNDEHGHHAGDQVLIAVAQRVTALLGDAGTVARLGGDEFAVLLPGADQAAATVLAGVLAAAVAEPIPVTGAVVSVGASIGIAVGTPADADRMLRDADAEMYRNKQSRRAAA